MKILKPYSLSILFCIASFFSIAQNPVYAGEKTVTINGYTLDAMEPHLSTDGNALFFNSLNDGITTSLYYAARVNDTTFNYVGAVPIVNQTVTPRLDAVASIDTIDNFYWVSTRNWPSITENLWRIRFLQSGYTNYGRVYGNFYISTPGWIIMDAAISYYGDKMIYCNAWFNSCANNVPCKAALGYAQKINDSTFNKIANTSAIFANVNDTVNYIVYAPLLTEDELELFYTRLLHNGTQTEIMVSTRSNTNSAFGAPTLLVGAPNVVPEGPTLTSDRSKMYYHKKIGAIHKICVRYRMPSTRIEEQASASKLSIYPNPVNDILYCDNTAFIKVHDHFGKLIFSGQTNKIDVSAWPNGIYFLNCNGSYSKKIVIAH